VSSLDYASKLLLHLSYRIISGCVNHGAVTCILANERPLGHVNISETMRYARFAPDHLEEAAYPIVSIINFK